MFGISFAKLLLLAGVVAIAWYGLRWYQARQAAIDAREGRLHRETERPDKRAQRDSPAARPQEKAEEMVACSRCGAYVPQRGASNCGREGCPFG